MSYSVEHVFGIVGIAVGGNAKVGYFPALFLKVSDNSLLKRISRKICAYYPFTVFIIFSPFYSSNEI